MNTSPTTYAIRVEGHLDDHWSAWLGDLDVTRDGDGTTTTTTHHHHHAVVLRGVDLLGGVEAALSNPMATSAFTLRQYAPVLPGVQAEVAGLVAGLISDSEPRRQLTDRSVHSRCEHMFGYPRKTGLS
jgi:hypothetical protein